MRVAIDAVFAAGQPHSFLGIHKSGQIAMVRTAGNPDGHLILRGGRQPNYDAASVAAACEVLAASGLHGSVMVDCSHGNSEKRHERQIDVVHDLAAQVASGSRRVFGVMIESHLIGGAQSFKAGVSAVPALTYGQSITDACLGWSESAACVKTLADAVRARRALA